MVGGDKDQKNRKKTLVSIIIPVYNKEEYISECFSCVVRQTWKNIEIVAVDDGSTDESSRLLHICTDSRLSIYHTNHMGVSAARNEGMRHAHGDFITFIDADDLIPFDYIETLMSAIGSADICMCSIWIWNHLSDSVRVNSCRTAIYTKSELLHTKSSLWFLFSNIYAKLFSASFLQKYRILFQESVDYGEDVLFFLNCLLYANIINTTNQTYYIYRVGIKNSLIDIYSFELQSIKKLMSRLNRFSQHVQDNALQEVVLYKQMGFLHAIGRIDCFQNDIKGTGFFSYAKKYNLINRSYAGTSLSKSEALTRFTLRIHWFLPFYLSTRMIFKNVEKKRYLFSKREKMQLQSDELASIKKIKNTLRR